MEDVFERLRRTQRAAASPLADPSAEGSLRRPLRLYSAARLFSLIANSNKAFESAAGLSDAGEAWRGGRAPRHAFADV